MVFSPQIRTWIALLPLMACKPTVEPEWIDLLNLVDPLIATGGMGFTQGSASPAATVPNGMVKVGPDTSMNSTPLSFAHCSGYWYEDDYVVAFSHTRLHGTGAADGGAIGIAPTEDSTVDWKRYRSPLDHDLEQASPGYYAIGLPAAEVELTATARAAYHRYDFRGEDRWLTVDLGHTAADHTVSESWLRVLNDTQIEGFVRMQGALSSRSGGQPTWFLLESSTPFSQAQLWKEGEAEAGEAVEGVEVAATLLFQANTELRIGISAVDLAGAHNNLREEIPNWDFSEIHTKARQQWEQALSVVEVAGASEKEQVQFATSLYHARQMPTLFTDADGRYRGADNEVYPANGWTYYTDFSLWDTYRTLHPLTQLLWPELALDYARSLVDMAEKRGGFPTWPQGVGDSGSMLGNAGEMVVAETYAKGLQDFNAESAFELADRQGTDPSSAHARDDLALYLDYGYVPSDLAGESVAKTLEYAIDDTALALFAQRLGKTEAADRYTQRAAQTRQLFDPESGFHRGKLASGEWDVLQEFGWGDHYTEGNAWQYAWLVPHDAEGLADSFGGTAALFDKLDTFMDLGTDEVPDFAPPSYYWHGNEPDLHAAFLYAQLGRPKATQKWVRWIQENRYDTAPAGYSGNDDGGTLAAWYAFAAMGLYPLNATDRYVLFLPLFESVRIHRPDGDLDIGIRGDGSELLSIAQGDQRLGAPTLSHSELLSGGQLVFEVQP